MADQLSIYNGALLLCGSRFLASLTEEREPRRLLDQVWDNGGGVKACLEQGQWNFAMRTVQVDYDSGIQPDFGLSRGFAKPSDWVLTSAMCSDEFFSCPLLQYEDEADYWYADIDTIYVRYVSNDTGYGLNMGRWPESFREYVEEYFCSKVILKITESADKEAASEKRLKKKLLHAKNMAAMAGPPRFPPQGSWGRARNGSGSYRRDGGNRGSLIG